MVAGRNPLMKGRAVTQPPTGDRSRTDKTRSGLRTLLARTKPGTVVAALALAGILAAAGYLRLARPGQGLMTCDQSVILGMALRWVKGGPLPLVGIKSSAGIMMPPMVEYLLAVPLFFRQEIAPVVTFNALLGLLAVIACYWVVAQLAGRRAALIATLLFAANPWAIHYSRFFWNQNMVPFFSTLTGGSLLLCFAGPRPRPIHLSLALLWLAVAIQLHLAALALIPVVALILLLFRRQVSLRHLALGVGLFLLSFLPYLLYQRMSGLADLRAMFGSLGGAEARLNLSSLLIAGDLATGHGLLEGSPAWRASVWPGHGLARLEGWLFAASLAYAAGYLLLGGWRELRQRQPSTVSATLAILLLWTVVPVLFYVRHTVYLQNYYLLYLLPAPFMLIGVAADQAWRQLSARGQGRWRRLASYPLAAVLIGSVAAIGAWQFHVSHVRLALEEARAIGPLQVRDLDHLIAVLRRGAAADPERGVIVISEGHKADASPFGLLADFVPGVRFVQDGRGLIVPAGRATYLDTVGSGWLQGRLGGALVAGEEVQAGSETWRFYHQSAAPLPASEPLGEWANGVRLLGCELEGRLAPGGTAELALTWQVARPADGQVYHTFNHLVHEPDGRLVSQEDGPGVHSPQWQEGDLLIARFLIPIPEDAPAGRYQVRVGMYTLAGLERVQLLDGSDARDVATLELP